MRKLLLTLWFSVFINFANAETLATFGVQSGDDIYEGYQIGFVQPLTEFDASASLTFIDDGTLLTVGAQKGFEVYTATMLYGFADINRFFWDSAHDYRWSTQLGWGIGISFAMFDPVFVDFKYKKFEEYGEAYTYIGLAYMF